MKTENLLKAIQAIDAAMVDLRYAHSDAVHSDNQFAEMALFDVLSEATALEQKLKRIGQAAGAVDYD